MINYRINTFETNSSSTHSLCIVTGFPKHREKSLNKRYIIRPFTINEINEDKYYFTEIEDKLRYLYTLYIQCYHSDEGWKDHPLCKKLYELIPNLEFKYINSSHKYIFEDGEILFESWDGCQVWYKLLEYDNLKVFLLEGIACFFNRDNEIYQEEYRRLPQECSFCEWEG